MTDHELQLKAVALRRAKTGTPFQPERLGEYSPALSDLPRRSAAKAGATLWVSVSKNVLHPERVQESFGRTAVLAPLQGAGFVLPFSQGSSRCARTTLGCILVAREATLTQSHSAAILAEAFGNYFGWEVQQHK